jgi:hypothetical protein
MNLNSDFDLKKAKSLLLKENYESSLQEMEVERLGIYDDIDNDVINGDWDSNDDIIDYLNSIIRYCNDEINSIKLSNPLEENAEALNEFASTLNIINALKNRNASGDQEKIDTLQNAEKAALSQFDLATAEITNDGRLKGFGSAFRKNLPSKNYFEDLAAELDLNPVFSTNTIEKAAANKLMGKIPNKPGKQANPNKPAAEPKAKVAKSPKLRITDPTAGEKPVAASFIDGEDEEDVAAEKQAIAAAKGGKRLGSAAEKLAAVTKEMKALIPAYQAAKGTPEEAAIVAQLKALTAEKKSLETKVNKMFGGSKSQEEL